MNVNKLVPVQYSTTPATRDQKIVGGVHECRCARAQQSHIHRPGSRHDSSHHHHHHHHRHSHSHSHSHTDVFHKYCGSIIGPIHARPCLSLSITDLGLWHYCREDFESRTLRRSDAYMWRSWNCQVQQCNLRLSQYFVFSFVRNPFLRTYSAYSMADTMRRRNARLVRFDEFANMMHVERQASYMPIEYVSLRPANQLPDGFVVVVLSGNWFHG